MAQNDHKMTKTTGPKTYAETRPKMVRKYGMTMFYKNGKHGDSPQEAALSHVDEMEVPSIASTLNKIIFVLEEDVEVMHPNDTPDGCMGQRMI